MVPKQAERQLYTAEQIEQYFDYIQFPKDIRLSPGGADTPEGLQFLNLLLSYQLSHVPFENLDIHYSIHHGVAIDVDHLYEKIVGRANGRGGYCMENNTFFGTMLRSLGYRVMPVGARVSSGANMTDDSKVDEVTYLAFSHTVNIVTIGDKKYFIDVGFGNRGPTCAVLLEEGAEGRSTGNDTGGNLFKLFREHPLENTHKNPEQLLWVYKVRFNTNMKYLPLYCFTEVEYLPQDFRLMSFFVHKSPTTAFTKQVFCTKFLVENNQIVGDITLFEKDLRERKFGKTRSVATFSCEQERVAALDRYFGIRLTKPEIQGIQGLVTCIG